MNILNVTKRRGTIGAVDRAQEPESGTGVEIGEGKGTRRETARGGIRGEAVRRRGIGIDVGGSIATTTARIVDGAKSLNHRREYLLSLLGGRAPLLQVQLLGRYSIQIPAAIPIMSLMALFTDILSRTTAVEGVEVCLGCHRGFGLMWGRAMAKAWYCKSGRDEAGQTHGNSLLLRAE